MIRNWLFILIILLMALVIVSVTVSRRTPTDEDIRIGVDKISKEQDSMQYVKYMMSEKYSVEKSKKLTDSEILKLMGPMTPIKTYDPWVDSERHANKILYEYLIENYSEEIERAKQIFLSVENFCEDSLHAIEFDLNDDGINEIIGIAPQNSVWGGLASTEVFIIGYIDGQYKSIGSSTYIYPRGENAVPDILVIFKEKTNGYHNMQFRKDVNVPTFIHLIKYLSNGYEFEFYR